MTLRQLAIQSDRGVGQYQLSVTVADVANDANDSFALPAGFGDCIFLGFTFLAYTIDTYVLTSNVRTAVLVGLGDASQIMDLIGTAEIFRIANGGTAGNTVGVAASLEFRQNRLWRAGELAWTYVPEIDDGGAPTVDYAYRFLVRKLKLG